MQDLPRGQGTILGREPLPEPRSSESEEIVKYLLVKSKTTGARAVIVKDGPRIEESQQPEEYARLRKLAIANRNRAGRDEAYRSAGLVKVRGALGGAYWE